MQYKLTQSNCDFGIPLLNEHHTEEATAFPKDLIQWLSTEWVGVVLQMSTRSVSQAVCCSADTFPLCVFELFADLFLYFTSGLKTRLQLINDRCGNIRCGCTGFNDYTQQAVWSVFCHSICISWIMNISRRKTVAVLFLLHRLHRRSDRNKQN